MMPAPSGKFGVGCKSVFTKKGTHCLVYYPVNRGQYNYAMQFESSRMPWRVFGDQHKLAVAKYEGRTTGFVVSGVLHLYDGLTIPAYKNGPIDPNI